MNIYWINQLPKGKIGMIPRPRGGEWLETDLIKLQSESINTIVSLLEQSEIRELGLQSEEIICRNQGIEYINYPIKDRSVPESKITFNKLIQYLHQLLLEDKTVLIHCRMGIGRTSLVCACLLGLHYSFDKNIFHLLSSIRKLNVPDTEDQKQWAFNFIESFINK